AFTIREAAGIVREQGEGFQRWYWYKPGDSEQMWEKVGFHKLFEPYGWWIGTGEYVSDFEREVQGEVLEWVNSVRFGQDGYIFVYQFDGVVRAHFLQDTIGTNVLQKIDDPYGIQVVGNLIANSRKPGGDFLEYEGLIRPSTGMRAQKIAFSRSVPDWEWTVGAGVYVDAINETIDEEHKKLVRKLIRDIGTIVLIFMISLLVIGGLIRRLSAKTADHLTVFTQFFKRAAQESIKIDDEEILFSEFQVLAESVNRMMDDREKAEEEVSRLRIYLGNIIDSMPSSLVGVDNEYKITQWNRRAQEMSGVAFSEAEGKKLGDILPRFAQSYAKISRAISQKKVFQETNCLTDEESKAPRYEDVVIFPLISNGAEGAVIRIDDVTKQYEMQSELSHSRRLDAIGQLAGGVAHDFNNMLAGIVGGADLIKQRVKDDDKARGYADMIMQSGQRAGDLINKLLAFARKRTVESTPISVKEALEEAVTILEHSLDKRVNIHVDIETESSMVIGDSSQIQNVLINLGINGGHAMPEGGDLTFRIGNVALDDAYCEQSPFDIKAGDYVQIDVSDTGVGIPAENREKIFEPFFTTREAGEGSGLGLAAVYGTVTQHRGAISLKSEVGQGTTFQIFLPLTNREKPGRISEEVHISGSGKILVIDDEKVLRMTASSILDNLGYEVLLAEDGESGLEIFREQYRSIDLVIMDMIMPKMNGKDCFYAMKEISPQVKVILTSGFSQEEDVKELRKDGLQGFLKKPYTTADVINVLGEAGR
ncbi:MAG: cache domain-containing protein, partial [Spirochaetales bacterium]|nr:cache domain-containing protein [Spirochaetales bacterium]